MPGSIQTRTYRTDEMMQSWKDWMTAHEGVMLDKGLPLGKTKRVTASGVADTKNDMNWYLVVEAESHTAAADLFKDRPQLHIPSAYIEVMDASRPGM